MDRQAKIEMLQMIQAGKLNPKDYEDLPGGVLSAITDDLGEFCNLTTTNKKVFFASKYEDENGLIYEGEAIQQLCERYGDVAPYVLHVVEYHNEKYTLIITGIYLLKQNKKFQLERDYFFHKKNIGDVQAGQ